MESIKHLKRSKQLIVAQTVKSKPVSETSNVYQVWVVDLSYSMNGNLPIYKKAVEERLTLLPEGSEIILASFSSRGEYSISSLYQIKKNLNGAISTVKSFQTTGWTCFDEVLTELYSNHLKYYSDKKMSLFFLTDGMHNDGPISSVIKALSDLKEVSLISVFAGFGYINREFMSKMAEVSDGSFVHVQNSDSFSKLLGDFDSSVQDADPKIEVQLPKGVEVAVSISGKNVFSYYPDEKGIIKYAPTKSNKPVLYYLLSDSDKTIPVVKKMQEHHEKGIRALSLIYSQRNNVPKALDILETIGDYFNLLKLDQAITNDEFAKAESLLLDSIFDKKKRYVKGKVESYLPPDDSYSVLDFMKDLEKQENGKIHLFLEGLGYNKIGSDKIQTDGAKVEYSKDQGFDVKKIVFNKSRLNISLSTVVKGLVRLDESKFKNGLSKEDLIKAGIAPEQIVSSFKTYTLVADGKLNNQQIGLSGLSNKFIQKLTKEGIIVETRGDIIIVDLSELPIGNKKALSGNTSATKLAKLVLEEYALDCKATVLRGLLKEEDIESEKDEFNQSAKEILEKVYYIKKGTYSPPVTEQGVKKSVTSLEADRIKLDDTKGLRVGMNIFGLGTDVKIESIDTKNRVVKLDKTLKKLPASVDTLVFKLKDFYNAYEFNISISGKSKASFKQFQEAKSITPRFETLKEFYEMLKDHTHDYLTEQLSLTKEKQSELAKKIQEIKLLIILVNKRQLDEFTSRDNQFIQIDGETVTFEIKEVPVYF